MQSKEVRIESLIADVERAREDLQLKVSDYENVCGEHNQLKLKMETINNVLVEKTSVIAEKDCKMLELSEEISISKDMACKQISEVEDQLSSLQEKLKSSEGNLRSVDTLLVSKTNMCDELFLEVQVLTNTVEQNGKLLSEKEIVISEKNKILDKIKEDMQTLSEHKADLEIENRSLNIKLEKSLCTLKETGENLSGLLAKAVKSEDEKQQLNFEIKRLNTEKVEEKNNINKEINDLKEVITQKQMELQKVTHALGDVMRDTRKQQTHWRN